MSSTFNTTVVVSDLMVKQSKEFAERIVTECASRYNFDAKEAFALLGLENINVIVKGKKEKTEKKLKEPKKPKTAFPLPYNGNFNEANCYALRFNSGLFTQCEIARKGDNDFCSSCQKKIDKSDDETPECGTIQQRMAVGMYEFVDPKGRKPIAYTKIMKKLKIDKEQVLEEAGKKNIVIDNCHFVLDETTKRGRPKIVNLEGETKVKGVKGRPKKTKKTIEIDGEEEEDLFAKEVEKEVEAEKEVEVEKEMTKEEKKAAEKEAKKAAAKAEKEAKKAAEKAAKAAEKAAEKAAKEAEKAAAKPRASPLEKAAKKTTATKKANEEEDEPDMVKKIDFEGKKYLKSKRTGIIYDLHEYTTNGEQVIVGKWNSEKNIIDFVDEEDEEEEDSEEEDSDDDETNDE